MEGNYGGCRFAFNEHEPAAGKMRLLIRMQLFGEGEAIDRVMEERKGLRKRGRLPVRSFGSGPSQMDEDGRSVRYPPLIIPMISWMHSSPQSAGTGSRRDGGVR